MNVPFHVDEIGVDVFAPELGDQRPCRVSLEQERAVVRIEELAATWFGSKEERRVSHAIGRRRTATRAGNTKVHERPAAFLIPSTGALDRAAQCP
jgi:hypothetical protein